MKKTQKLKLWKNLKTQIVTKKNINCDKTQKLKLWQNSKTHIVTKLNNSNCDTVVTVETVVTVVTGVTGVTFFILNNCDKTRNRQIVTKRKNSNFDKTQNLNFWRNSEIQIVTKLNNTNCDKTQIVTKLKNSQGNNGM